MPAGATVIFSAHGVSQAVRARSRRARPQGLRRDLPARDQGARRSRARCASRATTSCMIGHKGHPEVEGTMGQADDGHAPGRGRRGRRERCRAGIRRSSRSSRRRRCRSTTRAAIVAALKARFPRIVGPKQRRHLLRDAEPAGRGEAHGAAVRRGDRGRLARTAPTPTGCARSRERGTCQPTWSTAPTTCGPSGSRARARRRHRRRVGARGAGAGGDRAAERSGGGRDDTAHGRGGTRGVPPAQGASDSPLAGRRRDSGALAGVSSGLKVTSISIWLLTAAPLRTPGEKRAFRNAPRADSSNG